MKKAGLIFCAFYILNSQFSMLNCNAQVDSLTFQTENLIFETKTVAGKKSPKRAPMDSVQVKKHNPKTATLLALIPGAGQIYNKKYWKLPIVYGGLGATGYLIYYYGGLTSTYRKEYVNRANKDTINFNPEFGNQTDDQILNTRNFHRKNMEICVAACVIVYALSILDATVDAHLFYYDVSDNLAVAIKPKIHYNIINGTISPSVALVVKF